MRVLACAYACQPEGSLEWAGTGELILGWNIAKQLARFHEVWVLTHSQHREVIEERVSREPDPNLRFEYIDLPRWLRPLLRIQGGIQLYAYLWQVRALFAASRLHRRFRFNVFHHITFANDWMASFIGALLPIPYIRGPGGGAHRTPAEFLRGYSFRGRWAERLRALGQWALRRDPFFIMGQHRARAILVCNTEALEAIPRKWRHKAHLFGVNGVSTEDLQGRSDNREKDGTFRVLSAGKLLRLKAFDLGIRAFKIFSEKFSDTAFTLVGDGPELGTLETLAERLGVKNQVQFKGWLSRNNLREAFAFCDVFLFPSLRDGGGAVVVEAMAAGKPVICMDIAGPGMHVTNECGIKIPPQSPEQAVREMDQALECLYTKQPLRLRMGTNARRRAEELYDWDRLGDRLLGIYKGVLGTRPVEV
jgi:glycosyltransferase involved in cell wall biosynthesis